MHHSLWRFWVAVQKDPILVRLGKVFSFRCTHLGAVVFKIYCGLLFSLALSIYHNYFYPLSLFLSHFHFVILTILVSCSAQCRLQASCKLLCSRQYAWINFPSYE